MSAGDTIQPSQHNPAMSDIASALSSSLSRDGLGGMRAPLDAGGFRVSNMADGAVSTDAATVGQMGSAAPPAGVVVDFAGSSAPAGWAFCYGQALSRSTYAALFAAIGTIYGAGDGSTTFNLPDCRGRIVAGKDDMGGTAAGRLTSPVNGAVLGGAGGAQSHTLSVGEMPSHSHTVTDPGHQHAYTGPLEAGSGVGGGGLSQIATTTSVATTGITLSSTGGGDAHNNVQPTIVFNKIIRTGV